MRVLILGVSGMLGNAVFQYFHKSKTYDIWGTLRSEIHRKHFTEEMQDRLVTNIDVLNYDDLLAAFEQVKPSIVINCVGLIKQLSSAKDPLVVLPVNSMFPHRLAKLCALNNSKMIHISTDCVFSGKSGNYVESDPSDAEDLYGKSKYIGEITEQPHVLTIRTSIIGHELNSNYALVDWFLSQNDNVKGYTNAIFSGLPVNELANVIHNVVIPDNKLNGLYHVAAKPIDKYNLLRLIADVYRKEININPDHSISIDRSLNANRFREQTGYIAPDWPTLIEKMYQTSIWNNHA